MGKGTCYTLSPIPRASITPFGFKIVWKYWFKYYHSPHHISSRCTLHGFCDNKAVVVLKIVWHLQIRKLTVIGYKLRYKKAKNHKYVDRLSAKGKICKKSEEFDSVNICHAKRRRISQLLAIYHNKYNGYSERMGI